MSGLGEQIAVLDGLTIAPGDGMYGGGGSYPDAGRWPLLPSSAGLNGPLGAQNDLMAAAKVYASPSGGANYGGGSNYPDGGGFPTWAQPAGMAGFGAAGYPRDLPNVAPKKRVFASYSGGANRSGGSTYPDSGQFPTWAQAGAGLAGCGCRLDGMGTIPSVLPNKRVFASASGSANYSGGSNYPDGGRLPLLSSTIGLSGAPRMPAMTREQIMKAIQFHGQRMVNARNALQAAGNAGTKRAIANTYIQSLRVLCVLRSKAGLPTLPECQQLIARMKMAGMARARR